MRWTLNFYIARVFLTYVMFAFMSVFALIMIVDLVELLRENKRGTATFTELIGMAALHAPSVTIKAAPFTILLASMISFATLAHRSELVVTRAAGVSAFRIIIPAVVAAMAVGVFAFSVYNPVASAFAARYELLQERYFNKSSTEFTISGGGVWLRQGDETGQTVLRAERSTGSAERLWSVSVFQFDTEDHLFRRIEARAAHLEDSNWRLTGVSEWKIPPVGGPGADREMTPIAKTSDEIRIPTDLTSERIAESFAAPETISFWSLPEFILLLEDSGFSSDRHWMHFISLLATPLVFIAMVLIGAAFSMRHARFGGLGVMALGCVLTGFGYFFLSDVATALGSSGAVPVLLAGWAPPFAAVMLALGLLLHLEDG
ncbi:MAG: LPS export ABC transporter permease LptG [Pseudomonadota bacterium]